MPAGLSYREYATTTRPECIRSPWLRSARPTVSALWGEGGGGGERTVAAVPDAVGAAVALVMKVFALATAVRRHTHAVRVVQAQFWPDELLE